MRTSWCPPNMPRALSPSRVLLALLLVVLPRGGHGRGHVPMILRKVVILCGWQLMSVRRVHGRHVALGAGLRTRRTCRLALSATP